MDSGIFISHYEVVGLYDNRRIGLHFVSADFCDDGSFDSVMLAVPDHWHALVATEGARQKKEIDSEKPQAKTLGKQ
jgi:predicted dehydrogenase